MRVAQQSVQSESVQKSQPPVPPDPMLDRKLRMRYRITEHLVSTEFSDTYLAEDEDVPDRIPELLARFQEDRYFYLIVEFIYI